MAGKTMKEIGLGDTAQISKTVTEADVVLFAGVSGDFNPMHVNKIAAEKSNFGSRIAHGMLTSSFISSVIGNLLPGPGAIYLSQELKFVKPVYIGDTVTATVTVVEKIEEKNRIVLSTQVFNQNDESVIIGKAWVMPGME